MTIQMAEFNSDDLFIVVPEADGHFAKTVTCKLCGQIVFDSAKNASEEFRFVVHGVKAHYQIWHQITLESVPCQDPDCLKH